MTRLHTGKERILIGFETSASVNLLVTGGAGFIGSNLIQRVIDRTEVKRLINLDCLTYAGQLANLRAVESHPNYVLETVDLRDKAETFRVVRVNHNPCVAPRSGITRRSLHHWPGRFYSHQFCR